MKTKKLLLLVAGFMLFAVAAKAQHGYGITITNRIPYSTLEYKVTGYAYLTWANPPVPFSISGSVYCGITESQSDVNIYKLIDENFEFRMSGQTISVSRYYLERYGEYIDYSNPYGKFIVRFRKKWTGYDNHYDLEISTEP